MNPAVEVCSLVGTLHGLYVDSAQAEKVSNSSKTGMFTLDKMPKGAKTQEHSDTGVAKL
jgi:hypothetical protein